jgi:serine/threonine protein kinase
MDVPSDSVFPLEALPSRWARIVQGDPEAFRELAGSYWYCVYVWWRRTGLDAEQAATATVASFTRWAGTAPPHASDSDAGRMRQWLPTRLAELAAADWEEEGEPAIAIEGEWAEQHYGDEPEGDADTIFNRRWTLTVLEFAMQGLRAEYAARGLENLFAEASPFVGFEGADEAHYTVAAEAMGMTLGGMRRAIFELRTQHHDLLRTIVADTVVDPAEVDGEITALLSACVVQAEPGARPAPLPTSIRTFKPDELLARAMNTIKMTSGGAGKWTPPSDAEVARLFPQYEVRGIVGRGGMGAVYRAQQVTLDREVAIKLLPLEVSVNPSFADRFVREARAMAKLSHPNIISVYDFGTTDEGHLYFVMEFIDGADLSQIIRGPGLAANQALVIAGQVCTALGYAHGKGVIHRDIKPANVMVNTDGMAKVADFGLARLTDASGEQLGHTVTGTIMGTPEYMSPEQKRGMNVDHRADIYSMGVMLYEMICKEPPQGSFEPPSQRAGCDAGIDQIVLKAMNRTPENRYQSTVEMKADLDAAWQRQASGTPLPGLSRQTPVPQRMKAGTSQPLHVKASQPLHVKTSPPHHASTSQPPYVEPLEKSYTGLISALVTAVVVIGGVIFLQTKEKQSASNRVARVSHEEKSAPPSTPDTEVASAVAAGSPPPQTAPEAAPRAAPANERAPEPPIQPLSGPRDLLAGVDVVRDGVTGRWEMTAEGLRVTNDDDPHELFVFNYIPPEEYDFEIEFTIESGSREVILVVTHLGQPLVWKMGYAEGDPTVFSFGDTVDGQRPNSSGRKDGITRQPRLKASQRYRSLVQVRRDSLRALLDGNELLRWNGDFRRLEIEKSFLPADPRKIGVAAWGSTVVFHKAVVRPPGMANPPESPKPKPAAPSNVAAAPAASALVAESNDPRLVQLESLFKARFDNEAQKPYVAAIAALNQSYLATWLARIRPAAQAKGNLVEVTAIDAEKEAIGRGEGVPALDESDTPESLKNAHAAYRAAMSKITAARIKTGGQLYDLYLASLDAYVTELTRANKIDQAKKTRVLRDEIAARKAELVSTVGAEPSRTELAPGSPAAEVKAVAGTAASMREAAKWLVSKGGKFRISKGTLEGEVLTERDIPVGKFDITELSLDQRDAKPPLPTDSEMQVLRVIKGLRTVTFFSSGLGDTAFDFLAGNEDLTSVNFHTGQLTDGILSRLEAARKLNSFRLVYSSAFTGKGLDKMRWFGSLTSMTLDGCGLTDDTLKDLLSAPKLRALSLCGVAVTNASLVLIAGHGMIDDLWLNSCKGITDAGFANLAKLKILRTLNAQETSFGDLAAAAFASHTAIRELNLKGTELTDAGLSKLASHVRLQSLNVTNTAVTQAGVDAFKKSVPKCQLTY